MKRILSICLIINLLAAVLSPVIGYCETEDISFYVSPTGNDDNDGSKNNPFYSLERAQEEVRKVNKDMTGDIFVYLREGTYRLDNTLSFTQEDSGSNGYNVIWCGYDGEDVKISGGKQVTGWKKFDDKLWVADYNESEYVRQLYVNGNRARRAQSETLYTAETFLEGSAGYAYDGIITPDTKYSTYTNPEDIQFHFAKGWKSYLFNVLSVESQGKRNMWKLYNPGFTEATAVTLHHHLIEGDQFYLENAFEELDREGEFYFNRKEKKIYYMPRSTDDMNTADVEAAYIEKLMDIRGINGNNRVKNIIFKNIDFAHTTWLRPSRVGLVCDQAQWMHPDPSDVMVEPGYKMIPANIQLERAEKIQFIDNNFYDFGAVCIGMYQGVINCKFVGNTFSDIADSAITIGTEYQAYPDKEYKGYNLAHGKITSASSYDPSYYPMLAIDSSQRTGWSPNGSAPHWLQIDLGEEYEIDRIEVDARLVDDQGVTRNNFEIVGSNDPNFTKSKVLARQGAETFPHEGTAILPVYEDEKFRYVRIQKTNTDYFYIADMRVINESMEYAQGTETCKNIVIQNNYITRTSLVNWGAPGIQGYYVENVNISHNELCDLPYSGICVGWGWGSHPTSTACKDNKINYNRISNSMQMCFDGGCIYTLGQQPNTQIIGNYVGDQNNHLAGIYLDQGSKYMTLRDNVIENSPASFYSAVDAESNKWVNNYATSTEIQLNSNVNVYSENVNIFMPDDYPYEALVIMDNAGLTEKYKNLSEKVGENMWVMSKIDGMGNAKRDAQGVMNDDYFTGFYLKYFVNSANEWLKEVEIGDEEGQWSQSAVDLYSGFLAEADKLVETRPVDRDKILEYRIKFLDETKKFISSQNTINRDTLLAETDKELVNTSIGTDIGMVSQKDYNKLVELYNDAKLESDFGIKSKLLSSYLNFFEDKKMNLNISDVFITNAQLGNAVVDKNNATVDVQVKYSTDFASLKPQVIVHNEAKISDMLDSLEDGEAKYVVSTADGTQTKEWTLRLSKPEVVSSEGVVDLTDIIADKNNWLSFSTFNCYNYTKHLYGDSTLKFTINIDARSGDWPSIVFRSQEYEKTFMDVGNSAYVMVFGSGGVEFHRFNDGVRTQFYGVVEGCTTIFGESIPTEAFVFGENNDIEITTRNTEDGVHIVITINGTTLIDFVDTYEGVIKNPGYFGTISPGAKVYLGGK